MSTNTNKEVREAHVKNSILISRLSFVILITEYSENSKTIHDIVSIFGS